MLKFAGRGLLCACLLAPLVAHAKPSSTPSLDARIATTIEDWQRAGHYPGIAVAISVRGKTIYAAGHGFADLENKVAVTPDTVFPIGSITKSFTALSILQLANQGKLDLEAPVSTYLSGLPEAWKTITLHHLLTHRSGIQNYTSQPEFPKAPQGKFSNVQILGFVAEKPLLFAPGAEFSYSNTNTYLLGMVVETVSGISYQAYIDANIAKPFGMTHTALSDYRDLIAHRAHGYTWNGSGWNNAANYDRSMPFAAGAIVSTVGDLLRYADATFSERNPQRIRDWMAQTDTLGDGTPSYYSLGCLVVRDFEGHRKFSHSGVIEGFASHYAHYPNDGVTIAVLTNLQNGAAPPYALERKLARLVLNLQPPRASTVPSQPLSTYVGDFDVHPIQFEAGRYGFVVADGRLNLRYGGVSSPAPLMPMTDRGDGKFVLDADDEHTFQFSKDGSTVTVEFYDGWFRGTRAAAK